jgi:hypothetical protein
MPYRVILTITKRRTQTPGPLTWEDATALAKHHNENQLLDSWKYSIEQYDLQSSDESGDKNE